MPHIVVEYTPNLGELPLDAMLAAVTRILAGRTPEAKSDLSQRVAQGMREHMPQFPAGLTAYLSVEVVDMDRASYTKLRLN